MDRQHEPRGHATIDPLTASLRRRLRFAGVSYYAFDRIASAPGLRRVCRVGKVSLQRIPDQIARIGFDGIERVRTMRRVPETGNPEKAVTSCTGTLAQDERYRTYWYDASAHALVGIHLGLDVLRHGDRCAIVESNFSPYAGLGRRNLYPDDLDPLHDRLVATARSLGFTRVVPIAHRWERDHLDEFEKAGRRHGVTVIPTSLRCAAPGAAHAIVALPPRLATDTLYFIHRFRATALARYVHDKRSTAAWLARSLAATGATTAISPPVHDEPTIDGDPGPRWPNLVVKLAERDRGRAILMCRFADADEAARGLGLRHRGDLPRPLRSGVAGIARRVLFGRDHAIYQPFVTPSVDEHGRAQAIRTHVFVSPLSDIYLSSHLRVAKRPVPERVPHGVIDDMAPFVSSASAGTATYEPIARLAAPETELVTTAEEFGAALRHAVKERFETERGTGTVFGR